MFNGALHLRCIREPDYFSYSRWTSSFLTFCEHWEDRYLGSDLPFVEDTGHHLRYLDWFSLRRHTNTASLILFPLSVAKCLIISIGDIEDDAFSLRCLWQAMHDKRFSSLQSFCGWRKSLPHFTAAYICIVG